MAKGVHSIAEAGGAASHIQGVRQKICKITKSSSGICFFFPPPNYLYFFFILKGFYFFLTFFSFEQDLKVNTVEILQLTKSGLSKHYDGCQGVLGSNIAVYTPYGNVCVLSHTFPNFFLFCFSL